MLRFRQLLPALLIPFLFHAVATDISAEETTRDNQKTILAGPGKKARFKIMPPQWPTKYGSAHVCLWEDDKIACVTRAIDDNIPGEHGWWLKAGEKYNMKFTWFVIVHPYMFDYDEKPGSNRAFGNLKTFQKLFDAGHDVQAHGTGSINKFSQEDYERDLVSTKKILNKIEGNEVLVYAYPKGDAGKHRKAVAAKHFIAARGTNGAANNAARIDYAKTNDSSWGKGSIDALLNPKSRDYRGWISSLAHKVGMGQDEASIQASFDGVTRQLEYVNSLRNKLWITVYRKAALYGQERDTATLTVLSTESDKITLDLSDEMHDDIFDYPLTIKITLDATWDDLSVTQNGAQRDAKIILHKDKKFALIKAIPDRGEITVLKQTPQQVAQPSVDIPGGKIKGSLTFSLSCITSDAAMHYTTDGSEPTAQNPRYSDAVNITTEGLIQLRVRAFKNGLAASEILAEDYEIWHDKIAPAVIGAQAYGSKLYIFFSERVDATSAEKSEHYTLNNNTVFKPSLLSDQQTVLLELDDSASIPTSLSISDILDTSNNALISSEITIQNIPLSTDESIVAQWSFEEPNSSHLAIDRSSHVAPAIIKNAARTNGIINNAISVTSEDKGVIAANTNLGLDKTGKFTYSLWLRYEAGWSGGILTTKHVNPILIVPHYSKSVFRTGFRAKGTNYTEGKIQVPKGEWFHYAVVGDENLVTTYINGEIDTQTKDKGAYRFPKTNYNLAGGFNGMIDELTIYNRALSQNEIKTIVNTK